MGPAALLTRLAERGTSTAAKASRTALEQSSSVLARSGSSIPSNVGREVNRSVRRAAPKPKFLYHGTGAPGLTESGFDLSQAGRETVPNLTSQLGANFITDPIEAGEYAKNAMLKAFGRGEGISGDVSGLQPQMHMYRTAAGPDYKTFPGIEDLKAQFLGETGIDTVPRHAVPDVEAVKGFRDRLLGQGVEGISFPYGRGAAKGSEHHLLLNPAAHKFEEISAEATMAAEKARRTAFTNQMEPFRDDLYKRLQAPYEQQDKFRRVAEIKQGALGRQTEAAGSRAFQQASAKAEEARAVLVSKRLSQTATPRELMDLADAEGGYHVPGISTPRFHEIEVPQQKLRHRRRHSTARSGLPVKSSAPARFTSGNPIYDAGV